MAPTAVSATAAAGFDLLAFTRRTLVRRPESWVYAVAAGAALVLLLSAALPSGAASAHAHHHGASPNVAAGAGQLLAEWGGWMLMVLAMMLPVVAPDARRVAMRSLWHRRHRAMAWFLAGYLAVWAALGDMLRLASRACSTARRSRPPRSWEPRPGRCRARDAA